jgi:hypothetical protein
LPTAGLETPDRSGAGQIAFRYDGAETLSAVLLWELVRPSAVKFFVDRLDLTDLIAGSARSGIPAARTPRRRVLMGHRAMASARGAMLRAVFSPQHFQDDAQLPWIWPRLNRQLLTVHAMRDVIHPFADRYGQ